MKKGFTNKLNAFLNEMQIDGLCNEEEKGTLMSYAHNFDLQVEHNIESHNGDYAKFCDCGRDSFVCQVCGKVKCSIYYGTKNGRNTCVQCGGSNNE